MFEGPESPQSAGAWAVPGVDRPRPPVVLPAEVQALVDAVAGLRAWRPAVLDSEVSLACAAAVQAAVQAATAVQTRALADVEDRQLYRLAEARSTSAWLRQLGAEVPAGEVTLARKLAALPALTEELAAGRLPLQVAQRLQQALSRLAPHVDRQDGLIDGQPGDEALYGVIVDGVRGQVCEARGGFAADDDLELLGLVERLEAVYASPFAQLARLEAAFLVLAAHVEAGSLTRALATLVDALLPAQLEERARRGEQDRAFSMTPSPGGAGWLVKGELDLECGELLHTVLQAELTRDPDQPVDTDLAARLREQGLDPYDGDDTFGLPACARPRSRRQKLHDALKRGLSRYLESGLGGSHDKMPVSIVVTVPAATLDGRPGASPARGGSGAALPLTLVRQWACDSSLTRLVLGLAGRAIEASHTERTLKSHERKALYAQTGGVCQGSGCSRRASDPGAVMHPHHADPWSRCGTTSLRDSVLLCDSTHADVHHGHVIRLKDGRLLGPDGWVT